MTLSLRWVKRERELVLVPGVVLFAAALPVLVTFFAEPAVQREAARTWFRSPGWRSSAGVGGAPAR